MNVKQKLRIKESKEAINIINNTRILIDNEKLYIIADVNKVKTKEDFLSECSTYYYLSKEISTQDIQLRRVTIQSVIKESQSEDGASQRIQKRYRFSKLGATAYVLELK